MPAVVRDGDGRLLGISDLLDPATGLLGEYDGAQHREELQHALDNAREEGFEDDGLTVYRGDPTQDATDTAPSELDGLDYALAVGEDEALNAMVASDLSEYFGRGHVFQLPISERRAADFLARVPILFDDTATHEALLRRIEAGEDISVTEPAGANGGQDPRALLGANGIAMFVLTLGEKLDVVAAGDRTELQEGQELIGLR